MGKKRMVGILCAVLGRLPRTGSILLLMGGGVMAQVEQARIERSRPHIEKLIFAPDHQTGWLMKGEMIFVTKDGGKTWSKEGQPFSNDIPENRWEPLRSVIGWNYKLKAMWPHGNQKEIVWADPNNQGKGDSPLWFRARSFATLDRFQKSAAEKLDFSCLLWSFNSGESWHIQGGKIYSANFKQIEKSSDGFTLSASNGDKYFLNKDLDHWSITSPNPDKDPHFQYVNKNYQKINMSWIKAHGWKDLPGDKQLNNPYDNQPKNASDAEFYFFDRWGRGFLGYNAGQDSAVLMTNNNGKKWKRLPIIGGNFSSLFFSSQKRGWLTAGDTLQKTSNGGNSWSLVALPPEVKGRRLSCVCFGGKDQRTGWISGSGIVLTSTDGGGVWRTVWSRGSALHIGKEEKIRGEAFRDWWPPLGSIFVNQDPRQAWVPGPDGMLLSTVDGGGHWREIHLETTGNAYATSYDIQDGYEDALELRESINLHTVLFEPDNETGYMAGSQGRFYLTHDGGRSWVICALYSRFCDPARSSIGIDELTMDRQHDLVLKTLGKNEQVWEDPKPNVWWRVNSIARSLDGLWELAVGDQGHVWVRQLPHPDSPNPYGGLEFSNHVFLPLPARLPAVDLTAVYVDELGKRFWFASADDRIFYTDDHGKTIETYAFAPK